VTTCFLGYLTTLFQLLRLHSVEWEKKINSNGKKAAILQRMAVAHFRILHYLDRLTATDNFSQTRCSSGQDSSLVVFQQKSQALLPQ